MAKNKKTIIPPSLQPRKTTKKTIPGSAKVEKETSKKEPTPIEKPIAVPPKEVKQEQITSSPTPPTSAKVEKKRFTLWLDTKTYQAFKVHVAMSGGSASDYIESLIKKNLDI